MCTARRVSLGPGSAIFLFVRDIDAAYTIGRASRNRSENPTNFLPHRENDTPRGPKIPIVTGPYCHIEAQWRLVYAKSFSQLSQTDETVLQYINTMKPKGNIDISGTRNSRGLVKSYPELPEPPAGGRVTKRAPARGALMRKCTGAATNGSRRVKAKKRKGKFVRNRILSSAGN
jgi:hypothetical protein